MPSLVAAGARSNTPLWLLLVLQGADWLGRSGLIQPQPAQAVCREPEITYLEDLVVRASRPQLEAARLEEIVERASVCERRSQEDLEGPPVCTAERYFTFLAAGGAQVFLSLFSWLVRFFWHCVRNGAEGLDPDQADERIRRRRRGGGVLI